MGQTIITIRPDATVLTGSWTRTGGTTVHGVLSDNNDANYMAESPRVTEANRMELDYGSPAALPAGAKIIGVQPRFRQARLPGVGSAFDHNYKLETSGKLSGEKVLSTSSGTITTMTAELFTTRPDGAAWVEADFTSLRTRHYDNVNDDGAGRVYELYLDVIHDQRPVSTVTVPAEGGTIADPTPTVTWTYSDPEGDPQEAYRVKVFSAAQYGAGGFNPETSVATWNSGKVFSQDTSVVVGTPLAEGVWRAYVKVYQAAVQGVEHGSAWDNNQFTVDVVPPPTPSVVATFEPATNRVKLDITRGSPDTPTTDYYIVERSITAGVAWATIRGGSQLLVTGGTQTIYDYEAPPMDDVLYRVTGVDTGTGIDVQSAPSANASVDVTLSQWWLKDPVMSADNLVIYPAPPFPEEKKERIGIFEPLGATEPKWVAGSIFKWDGDMELFSEIDHAVLELQLDKQVTLLLQSPSGLSKYVRITKRSRRRPAGLTRNYAVSYVEVAAP